MQTSISTGMTVYCVIGGDIRKRKIVTFSTDGHDLTIITDRFEDLVWLRDAFPTEADAKKEIKTRLRDS